jgi:hypothetical protein
VKPPDIGFVYMANTALQVGERLPPDMPKQPDGTATLAPPGTENRDGSPTREETSFPFISSSFEAIAFPSYRL